MKYTIVSTTGERTAFVEPEIMRRLVNSLLGDCKTDDNVADGVAASLKREGARIESFTPIAPKDYTHSHS